MFSRSPQSRFLLPVALTSLLLLGLCVFAALFLLREQAGTTARIGENVVSQREASELKESLADLIDLLHDRVEGVDAIHRRIEKHLESIRGLADKPEEQILADDLGRSFEEYLERWKLTYRPEFNRDTGLRDAVAFLETDTMARCQKLLDYNTTQIERSEQDHRQSLRRLAWVMAGLGIAGGVVGLVLGYGVARGLTRSIHRLRIGLQDAHGKLDPNLPEIVIKSQGDLPALEEQVQSLVKRVEEIVRKLQEREHEVLRAEQLSAVGHLAAGVAHEIRNPLTSIKMLVQAGREDPAGLPDEDLEVIEREIQRMEHSLKALLDFARLPKPARSSQDLGVLAARTLDLVRGRAAKQGVQLSLDAPRDGVFADVDREQIQQVLVNLSLNALDAMPTGGTLSVVVDRSPTHIELLVNDTGPGIAPETMPHLFQPFFSTKDTGVGLGLVISRRIAEEHGGTLTGNNRPGGGARFSLVLCKADRSKT